MYAHKGRTKKLKRHGLHGFALDQPSINGIGPINRSEKKKRSETVGNGRKTVGNGRKRSETVGNGRKHDQAKTCPTRIFLKINISAQRSFFLKVQRCPRGNGWKQSEIAPLLGKKTGLWGCDPPCSTPWDSPQAQATRCYRRKRWPCGRRGTSRAVLRLKPLEDVEKPWFPWEKKSTKVDFPHLA